MASNISFDYVIVGGGTAGLILANRLSENPNITVGVIEAGGNADADPRVAVPGMFTATLGSELDWGFGTTPQEGLNGRRIGHAQGKLVGGSSSINAQALIPFSEADINCWEDIGNKGWNWETLSIYLPKPFTVSIPDEDTSEHLHINWATQAFGAKNGPVNCSFADVKENPVGKAWIETFERLGHPLTASPFSGNSIGPYNAPSTVNPTTKTRSSSSTAYYHPAASRTNLNMLLNSTVASILLESAGDEPRATGVQLIQDGNTIIIKAKKEVILCAGVFNTPKIMELSGIGDPRVLQAHGIEVKVANPYVGRNLQDHVLCAISYEADDGIPTGDDLSRQDPTALQMAMNLYQNFKAGPFATPGITSFGYLPTVDFTQDAEARSSALEAIAADTLEHPLDSARGEHLRQLLESGNQGTGQYYLYMAQSLPAGLDTVGKFGADPQPGNFISLVTALSHPLSTGSSHISSADVNDPPTIDHCYLSHSLDLELHARHVRYLETIAAAKPFASLLKPNGRRNDPQAFVGDDLEKAKQLVKNASTTNWHSCGTCAMAPKDKGGVVDEALKVYGVSSLRIVDASIFPFVPQSNLQSLVYTVAERASDIIKGNFVNSRD